MKKKLIAVLLLLVMVLTGCTKIHPDYKISYYAVSDTSNLISCDSELFIPKAEYDTLLDTALAEGVVITPGFDRTKTVEHDGRSCYYLSSTQIGVGESFVTNRSYYQDINQSMPIKSLIGGTDWSNAKFAQYQKELYNQVLDNTYVYATFVDEIINTNGELESPTRVKFSVGKIRKSGADELYAYCKGATHTLESDRQKYGSKDPNEKAAKSVKASIHKKYGTLTVYGKKTSTDYKVTKAVFKFKSNVKPVKSWLRIYNYGRVVNRGGKKYLSGKTLTFSKPGKWKFTDHIKVKSGRKWKNKTTSMPQVSVGVWTKGKWSKLIKKLR